MSGQGALIHVPPGLRSKPSRDRSGPAKDGAVKGTSILAQRFDPDNHKRLAGAGQMADDNPKRDANPNTNTEKDPDDWVSGGDPMTGAQASYLKTLSEEAHQPDAYAPNLTKAEASKRIDALKQRLKERDR
jgi:Protein of unknown function (DUF3072)